MLSPIFYSEIGDDLFLGVPHDSDDTTSWPGWALGAQAVQSSPLSQRLCSSSLTHGFGPSLVRLGTCKWADPKRCQVIFKSRISDDCQVCIYIYIYIIYTYTYTYIYIYIHIYIYIIVVRSLSQIWISRLVLAKESMAASPLLRVSDLRTWPGPSFRMSEDMDFFRISQTFSQTWIDLGKSLHHKS